MTLNNGNGWKLFLYTLAVLVTVVGFISGATMQRVADNERSIQQNDKRIELLLKDLDYIKAGIGDIKQTLKEREK